ncbi:molybdopterin-binding protein, partial [Paracraurococcus ruber]
LPPAAAIGHVLASPLLAPGPVPPAPVALQDGWAVAAAATLGAGAYSPVPLPAPPVRVAAGEALPPGTDAVLPDFALEAAGPFAQALEPVAPGEGVRQPGEEIAAGTRLRAAGERLAVRDLPALAACGIAEVALRIPRLAWIEAGPVQPGLAPLLAALVAAEGAELRRGDAAPGLAEALRAAAGEDLVLLAGSVGPGETTGEDAAAALGKAGRLVLHGIGARPGQAAGLGAVAGTPVLLLPGRAEDALAAWWLLGRPAVRALAGAEAPPARTARLARSVPSAVGLLEIVPLRLEPAGLAVPLALGAVPLAALSAADALLLVPPGSEGYEAGQEVPLILP